MKKDLDLWLFIHDRLKAGERVMLLVVAESSGSSPGRQGFKMAVSENEELTGSIGGGIMEVKLVELAKKKLLANQSDPFLKKQYHDKVTSQDQSGMICSGEQTVIYFLLDHLHQTAIENIIELLKLHRTAWVTLSNDHQHVSISIFENSVDSHQYFFEHQNENLVLYRERMGYEKKLFIIGAGHCGLALSVLMSGLDFFIHVIDDRPELNTMERNDFAHEKTIIDDYSRIADFVPEGDDVYVVIMTQGYRSDKIILQQLAGKRFAYIGLLGSEAKIAAMKKEFEENGNANAFDKVHAPIGLKINSRTPEEIAVSIAAQLISIKNQ